MVPNLLEWALRYYDAGWQIMPCKGKVPIAEALELWGGKCTALRTERVERFVIEWWWNKWPDAQIALICGSLSGVTVLDCDVLKTGGGELPANLATKYAYSMTSITGGGGRHVFFTYKAIPNSVKTLHPQLDIRSEGGYVILPPSIHHETGLPYEWDKLFPFNEETLRRGLAPFPDSLALTKPARTAEDWDALIGEIKEGNRNNSMAKIVGKLLTVLEAKTVWKIVQALNAYYFKPPLLEAELWATFSSITRTDYAKYPRR